jgi:hypothetical protein
MSRTACLPALLILVATTATSPADRPPVPPTDKPAEAKAETVTFEDLFHLTVRDAERALGAARAKKMQAALEDFNAVLAYKRPVHAKLGPGPFFKDGGTLTYEGNGYDLTVIKSLFSFDKKNEGEGEVNGYTYGPTLLFKESFGLGNMSRVSRVSFYPAEVLEKALK